MDFKINTPTPPKPPKNHKWEHRGWGWVSKEDVDYCAFFPDAEEWGAFVGMPKGLSIAYYLEAVRTYRDKDGTPIELPPLPEMPSFVEKVEYFGTHMNKSDMGDSDSYMFLDDREWVHFSVVEAKECVNEPSGTERHYVRVWYKKNPETRETLKWGSFGVNGDQNLKKIKLCDMKTNHIENVLLTQGHISSSTRELMQEELKIRKGACEKINNPTKY